MRILRNLLCGTLLLSTAACDGGEPEEATTSQPVELWQADSSRLAGPTAGASTDTAGVPDNILATFDGGASEAPQRAGTPSPRDEAAPDTAASEGTELPAAGSSPAPAPADTTATEVLLRAERAYDAVRTLQADFVQDLTVPLLESTQRSRGEIFHRKPDLFLMRFSDPAGDIVVADGRHLWLYYPSTDPKQVVRTSMGQAGRLDLQREFLSNPTERFRATLDGSAVVDGRPSKVLTLVPKGQSPYQRVRIWVDDRDGLVRRFEITERNDAVRIVELHDLRVNQPLQDELFSFTPPPGAEVFDQ